MLKFPLFTIGYAWKEEYGDVIHNRTHFKYVQKYSPLHNVPHNLKQYPNMLVVTADHDDRVVPAHSYKFIAELQYRLGKKLPNTPLMIRIDSNSGHGAGKPVSKWVCVNDFTFYIENNLSFFQIFYRLKNIRIKSVSF